MCLTLGPCDAGLGSKVTVDHVGGGRRGRY